MVNFYGTELYMNNHTPFGHYVQDMFSEEGIRKRVFAKPYYWKHNAEYGILHRQQLLDYAMRSLIADKIYVVDALGGKCANCGERRLWCLEIDHIAPIRRANLDAYKHESDPQAIVTGLRSLKNLQLLCSNCHMIKSYFEGHVSKYSTNSSAEYNSRWMLATRIYAIDLLGGLCKLCGDSRLWCLQIDHIVPERRSHGNHAGTLECDLFTGKITTDNLQLLCANCHSIKTYFEGANAS